MVSRIEVIPEEVRGYGNIMKVKDVDDFSLVNSVLSLTDGVYNLTAESGPSPTPTYDGVSLSSDKSILSYADSETCTLTAQLLDGSTPVSESGVTVEFFKGSTSLGTATTNASGVATKTYSATGSGDISLTAEVGSLVSESYVVEDCLVYDPTTSNKSSKFLSTNITFSFDTDHYNGLSSAASAMIILTDYTGDFEAELDLSSNETGIGGAVYNHSDSVNDALYFKQWGTSTMIYQTNSSGTESTKKNISHNRNSGWYHLKVIKENGNVRFIYTLNGNSVFDYNQSFSSIGMIGLIQHYANRTISFKNIKVKAL